MKHHRPFSINPLVVGAILLFTALLPGSPVLQPALASDTRPMKVALLPILDSFPFYVAEAKGYFDTLGLEVKAVPVVSGLERDQLMQSGEIDGMLNEMMSSANFNREKVRVKIVAAARQAAPDAPLFRILSAPGSRIDTPQKLAGGAIGIAKNTIIEYVTDRLLAEAHLSAASVEKQSIPAIPERYQLLMQGRLQAATLPDPLAKSAMEAGAVLVIDDAAYPKYSMSVLTFSVQTLDQRPQDVRRFLKAWDRAAADINSAPDEHRDLLLQNIRVPKNVHRIFKIPAYPRGVVPNPAQWADVMDWMIAKGLLDQTLPYADSITAAFLP